MDKYLDIRHGRSDAKLSTLHQLSARRNVHTRTTGADLSDCLYRTLPPHSSGRAFFFSCCCVVLFCSLKECRKPVRHFGTVRTQNEERGKMALTASCSYRCACNRTSFFLSISLSLSLFLLFPRKPHFKSTGYVIIPRRDCLLIRPLFPPHYPGLPSRSRDINRRRRRYRRVYNNNPSSDDEASFSIVSKGSNSFFFFFNMPFEVQHFKWQRGETTSFKATVAGNRISRAKRNKIKKKDGPPLP